jgi:hypothetical protein
LFRRSLRRIISDIGDQTTGEQELREYGLRNIPNFVGVFPNDRVPPQRHETEALIVNTDPAGTPGTHWTALYRHGPEALFWDSYGRSASELLSSERAKDCERDSEQRLREQWCGAGCLAWLRVCNDLGPAAAQTV